MSFPKKAAFYAILALVVLVASEMVSSAFLFFAYRDQISSLSGERLEPSTVVVLRKGLNWLVPGSAPDPLPYRRMTRIPQDFFAEDAEQGYRARPGRYVFRYTRRQGGALEHLDSVVTINRDGTRFTGNAPAAPARQIHVLGDSFVFGDGVNDQQTFSFLLQSALPRDAVHLHALSGYSWANALVTMERIKDQIRPGDIVILDNLGSHRSKAVRQLIRSVGAKLFFLPKYSPDLNPIEQVFAKLKHLLRKAAARTVDAVCAAIGHALDAFTSAECANYLKNSGYRT